MKKKIFSLIAVVMLISSNLGYANNSFEDDNTFCEKFALYIMDAIENTYGCIDDAEDYNDSFEELEEWCERGTADD